MKKIVSYIFKTQPKSSTVDISLLVFRVLISLSMINTHGMKKIVHFEESIQHIPDPFGIGGEISTYIAITANIVAPIFVIFGFVTRLAALVILSVTLIGFFVVHANDPWTVRDIPLMYSLAFLLILYLGAGKYSIDHNIYKRNEL